MEDKVDRHPQKKKKKKKVGLKLNIAKLRKKKNKLRKRRRGWRDFGYYLKQLLMLYTIEK